MEPEAKKKPSAARQVTAPLCLRKFLICVPDAKSQRPIPVEEATQAI